MKANPDAFSAQTVSTANWLNTDSLYYDYSADADLGIANAVLTAAGAAAAPMNFANGMIDALNGVGSGLSNAGKLLPIVLPLALVLAAIILSKSGARRAESAVSF